MSITKPIFARNCEARRIDKQTAEAFLSLYHRFGDAKCRYRYGLFVKRRTGASECNFGTGSLVAVAEFSNARRWVKEDGVTRSYEWIRYASPEGVRIVGGMGKLLQLFVDELHPDDVMSYADPDWGDGGNAYLQLGFTLEGEVSKNGWRNLKFRKTFKTQK